MDNEPRCQEIRIRAVGTPEEFRVMRESWNALLAESPVDSYFLRWEWLWAWWSVYAEHSYELCILLVYRGDTLVGIGPFYINNTTWKKVVAVKQLMFLGTSDKGVISEYLDVIYRTGHEEPVLWAIMDYLSRENSCHEIRLHKMDASSKTIGYLQKLADDLDYLSVFGNIAESPYITLPADYGDFLAKLSGSTRHSINSNLKKLQIHGEVGYRRSSTISELDADLEELVRLHRQRWESRKQRGAFSEKFLMFQKKIMPDMLKNGHLDLWFLSVSGRNISALYNIRYKKKIYFYQSGLDTSFDRNLAPGQLLHNYCIKQAIHEHLEEYDFMFMGNHDSYKKRWTMASRRMGDMYLARPGLVKLAATAKNKARKFYHLLTEGAI